MMVGNRIQMVPNRIRTVPIRKLIPIGNPNMNGNQNQNRNMNRTLTGIVMGTRTLNPNPKKIPIGKRKKMTDLLGIFQQYTNPQTYLG